MSAQVLGIDVGGTSIKAEVLDRQGNTIARDSVPTPRDAPSVEPIAELAGRLIAGHEVLGVGLAAPGIVDIDAGTVVNAVNLGWRDVPVVAPLEKALNLPIHMTHDVLAAGFAEWRLGAGRGTDDLLVVVIGTGIAAVIVAGGQLVTGGLRQAGELGHIVVRPDGRPCPCGQSGCLEAVASARAIADAYGADGADVVRQHLGVDPMADAVWADAVDALADGLVTTCALFSPTRIVIGGGLAGARGLLLNPVHESMIAKAKVAAVPELVRAELGSRAGVVGAGLRAWDVLST